MTLLPTCARVRMMIRILLILGLIGPHAISAQETVG